MIDLKYSEIQRPIVAQIFSSKPDNVRGAAKLCAELGFDGIDINMGCPVRTINKQLAGAEMIRDPELAREVILAAKEGAGDLPVSVKSRIGYNKIDEMEEWMNVLLEAEPAAITMHLRTKKEMSKVPAHWELASKLVELRGDRETLIFANGDITDLEDAEQKVKEAGLDGVMIGRGVYGNPWLYAGRKKEDIPLAGRIEMMVKHTKMYDENFKGIKNFSLMRKFFGAYIAGHPKAKKFREELNKCDDAEAVEAVVAHFA